MLKILDDGLTEVECKDLNQMCAELGVLYGAFLEISEMHGIPWGNARQTFSKCMSDVEKHYNEKKHKELKKMFEEANKEKEDE